MSSSAFQIHVNMLSSCFNCSLNATKHIVIIFKIIFVGVSIIQIFCYLFIICFIGDTLDIKCIIFINNLRHLNDFLLQFGTNAMKRFLYGLKK